MALIVFTTFARLCLNTPHASSPNLQIIANERQESRLPHPLPIPKPSIQPKVGFTGAFPASRCCPEVIFSRRRITIYTFRSTIAYNALSFLARCSVRVKGMEVYRNTSVGCRDRNLMLS
jgi:hypothetical protein